MTARPCRAAGGGGVGRRRRVAATMRVRLIARVHEWSLSKRVRRWWERLAGGSQAALYVSIRESAMATAGFTSAVSSLSTSSGLGQGWSAHHEHGMTLAQQSK